MIITQAQIQSQLVVKCKLTLNFKAYVTVMAANRGVLFVDGVFVFKESDSPKHPIYNKIREKLIISTFEKWQ